MIEIKVIVDLLKVGKEPKETNDWLISLAKNSVIKVSNATVQGEESHGSTEWYKDSAGYYYPKGGVEVLQQESEAVHAEQVQPGFEVFDLSEELRKNIPNLPDGDGEGITIAVLDSGIDKGFPSIKNSIIDTYNFQDDTGFNSHGTRVAGFLVSKTDKLHGLCSKSKILDIRVVNDSENVVDSAVVKGLKFVYDWNIDETSNFCDIVNMSLDINYQYEGLQSIIEKLTQQGVIITVAGNDGESPNSIANLSGVIPIGTFYNYQVQTIKTNGYFNNLKGFFLNQAFQSTSKFPDYELFNDSSAYTAIITGIISKYLSSNAVDLEHRNKNVLSLLKEISNPINTEPIIKSLTLYT